MNRSPLFYPLNRGMDADAGGAADLQTDVMRFMAIISMCLVAIFALVQSIPLAPVPTQPPLTTDEPVIEAPEPVAVETQITLNRPMPAKIESKEESVVLQRPTYKPPPRPTNTVARTPAVPTPAPAAESGHDNRQDSATSSAPRGFTLRFESDAALTRLVARNTVGLYAISTRKTQRMSITGDDISFWAASAPESFHEMDVTTVPHKVLTAYQRGNPAGGDTKWGVSIPIDMSRQLNRYLSERDGGALIIGIDGQLRLEP